MLYVLFCLGCCRAPFCLLSAPFFMRFPKLFVQSNGVDFVVVFFSVAIFDSVLVQCCLFCSV